MPSWWRTHQDRYCFVCGTRAARLWPGQKKRPCQECGSRSFYRDRERAALEDGMTIPKHNPGRRGPRQVEVQRAMDALLWEEIL